MTQKDNEIEQYSDKRVERQKGSDTVGHRDREAERQKD